MTSGVHDCISMQNDKQSLFENNLNHLIGLLWCSFHIRTWSLTWIRGWSLLNGMKLESAQAETV